MRDAIVALLLAGGSAFGLISAIGILRLPDLYTRMQAAAKAGALAMGMIATACAIHFGTVEVSARAILIVFFVFLTSPVAAQVIGRAAYVVGVPLWKGTRLDERSSAVQKEGNGGAPEQRAGD